MKTLSLKQPFAELILQGKKKIELRKWNTKFRGEFFIHASKAVHSESMKKFGFNGLPTGGIVGKVNLIEVKDYSQTKDFDKDKDRHLATEEWGKYGFILEGAERTEFIPCKGFLNFWEFDSKA